jgi:hypothetical protein
MPLPDASLTFSILHSRLLDYLRTRIRNGELSERGLARMAGLSQPHIHNVLKGARFLSSEAGDMLAHSLGLSLLELATADELGSELEARLAARRTWRFIPVLRGQLSPWHPFPEVTAPAEWLRVQADAVAPWRSLVLAAFLPDDENVSVFAGNSMLLLDLDERERVSLRPEGWYALRWGGAAYVRQVRRETSALCVRGQRSWSASPLPDRIALEGISLLSVIRATVVWAGPDLHTSPLLGQAGKYLAQSALCRPGPHAQER